MVNDLVKACGTEKIFVLFRENTDLVSNIYICVCVCVHVCVCVKQKEKHP